MHATRRVLSFMVIEACIKATIVGALLLPGESSDSKESRMVPAHVSVVTPDVSVEPCVDEFDIVEHIRAHARDDDRTPDKDRRYRVVSDAAGTTWWLEIYDDDKRVAKSSSLHGDCDDVEIALAIKIATDINQTNQSRAPLGHEQDDEPVAPPSVAVSRRSKSAPLPTLEPDESLTTSVTRRQSPARRTSKRPWEFHADGGWSSLPGHSGRLAGGQSIEIQFGVDRDLSNRLSLGTTLHLMGAPRPGGAPTESNAVLGSIRLCHADDVRRIELGLCALVGGGNVHLVYNHLALVVGMTGRFGVRVSSRTSLRASLGGLVFVGPTPVDGVSALGQQLLLGFAQTL